MENQVKKTQQHRNKYFVNVGIPTASRDLVKELCSMLHVKQTDLLEELIQMKFEAVTELKKS
ncbi:hypothetical protein D0N36_07770 [Hymenobacter lapidiphilus]|nr:hypothetical protein D0N36_07770 [Hymenobacter sp. CCM 8763]